jgi:hypothetical protein
MKLVSYEELLQLAITNKSDGLEWHHHYLPPNCALNKSERHQIILECGTEAVCSYFDAKPMPELEKLENIFFGRV